MKINAWWCMLLEKKIPSLHYGGRGFSLFLLTLLIFYLLLVLYALLYRAKRTKACIRLVWAFLLPFLPSNCPILLARNDILLLKISQFMGQWPKAHWSSWAGKNTFADCTSSWFPQLDQEFGLGPLGPALI